MASYLRVLRCLLRQPSFTAPTADLRGQTVVVTGPTAGGIGFETAKALTSFGARVVLAARNLHTAERAADFIRAAVPTAAVHVLPCDVAQLASVRAFAARVAPLLAGGGVDVLVCNAGATCRDEQKTREGAGATFAVCALGHHLLVHLLRPRRLVWVSGDIYALASGNVDACADGAGEHAYFQACLGRMLLAREWKRRAAAWACPMEVVAVHPGVIDSEFSKTSGVVKRLAGMVLITPEQGAQASILAASAASAELHQERALPYYHNKHGWLELAGDDLAMDEEGAARLFAQCNQLCGMDGGRERDGDRVD